MQLQYVRNGRLFTFTTVQRQHTLATVLALPAPPLIERAALAATPPPPRNILSRASRARHPNALDYIDTTDVIFEHMRQATLRQRELRTIAMAISDSVAAQAWSLDQGLIFFDGRLYLPAASSLLPYLLQVLRRGGSANMELLALGAHPPPMRGQHNGCRRASYLDAHGFKGALLRQRRSISSTT